METTEKKTDQIDLVAVLKLLLKKWKILVVFALICAVLAYVYTANFAKVNYTSSIEFFAYVEDSDQELIDSTNLITKDGQKVSETSKINYAMKMLNTYIEIFKTNEFSQMVADEINTTHGTSLTAAEVKKALSCQGIEETAMFTFTVTTHDADLSYNIATALEKCVPQEMQSTNKGLVRASVEDKPLKSVATKNYTKSCLLGVVCGLIIAAAYVFLRDFFDIRVKSEEELTERYGIPVIGVIPTFDLKSSKKKSRRG